MSFKRDYSPKGRGKGERPKWLGPVPSKYYYMAKNERHPNMSAYIVRFTDVLEFKKHVRQITSNQNGNWSLIESDVPLPTGPNCKLRSHSKIEEIKKKMFESHERKLDILDENGERASTVGIVVSEEEVFG